MMNVVIIVTALALASYLAFSKRLANSSNWKVTVTPLASIMGSGFLVSAPLLAGIVGNWALVSMAVLLVLAYLIGEAIRFNIRHFEPIENEGHGLAQNVAFLSRIVLAGAYFISVTYYLQLLAAFVLNAIGVNNPLAANAITTVILITIGLVGILRGLDQLEGIEKYAVSLNLGMIGALLLSLAIYNIQLAVNGNWALPNIDSSLNWNDMRILLGLLIVVQGFETSRYLGDQHPAEQRISTMRSAQLISTVIYLTFIGLATVLFHEGLGADVTAIISMTKPVAIVLPIRYAYLLILLVTVVLTWETDVNGIITYASRAFALFYMLQCEVALLVAWQKKDLPSRRLRMTLFASLAMICLAVFALGLPSE
jgi:hypothetical protein